MSVFTEANRKAFNDLATSYNSKPWQIELSNTIGEALQARKEWFEVQWADPRSPSGQKDVRLLDYACGTGAITKALGPDVTTIRGIDISENMVQKYNEAAQSSGMSHDHAHAVVGDLCGETVDSALDIAELRDFDIAVIGLGFHHFENPALAVQRLGERLKAGSGVLVIIDFLPFSIPSPHNHGKEGDFPAMEHTIKHSGFTGDQMRDLYQKAGFTDFDIVALAKPVVMELKHGRTERTVFIAKGKRAQTTWQKFSSWVGAIQDTTAAQFSYGADPQPWNQGLRQDDKWNAGVKAESSSWNGVDPAHQKPSKPWTGM